MARKGKGEHLSSGERVVAAVDLPGIPAGTPGKVILVNGFEWIRYRVYFATGQDRGSLDRSQLARPDEWADRPRTAA